MSDLPDDSHGRGRLQSPAISRPRPRCAALLFSAATLCTNLGASAAAPEPAPATPPSHGEAPRPTFELGDLLTLDAQQGGSTAPFDLVVGDMDLDGDDDLIASRHFFGLLLYENVDGELELLNSPKRDAAGLDVPPGVRSLHGTGGVLEAMTRPAVLAWGVRNSNGDLRVEAVGRRRRRDPAQVIVTCSEDIEVGDATEGSWERVSPHQIAITLPKRGDTVSLRLRPAERTPFWSLQQVDQAGEPSARPTRFLVGADLDRFDGDSLSFWAQDPHGLAWAQFVDGPEPELVVVRGGSLGHLTAQGEVKEHLLYRWVGDKTGRFHHQPGALPSDAGRGRAAAWTDVDNDGVNELFLTNRDSAPSLMVWSPQSEQFEDLADTHGLDAVCSELGAWIDLDDDGWQDLVSICEEGLEVAHNLGVGAFLIESGSDWGLDLSGVGPPPRGWMREDAVHVLDLNGDDRLDLWLAGVGRARLHRVLLAQDGGGYLDATTAFGLADATGVRDLRPLDADMDGWMDALVQDGTFALLWNRPGPDGQRQLERIELTDLVDQLGLLDTTKATGVGIELDGDGRPDIVIGAGQWRVLHNRTPGPARSLRIDLDAGDRPAPVGALFRARYADGHTQRIRYGSHARSSLSQSLSSLYIGLPAPGALRSLEVRWPGQSEWQALTISDDVASLVVTVPLAIVQGTRPD